AAKIEGARHVLLDLNYFEGRGRLLTSLKMLLTAAATLAAGLALARPSRQARRVAIAAMSIVILLLAVRVVGHPDTAPGVVPAWPIAVIGLILFRWRTATETERALAGVIVLELLATLATQYPEGGAIEWGARYLSPLYPLVAVLA